jgi:hypothetical protein
MLRSIYFLLFLSTCIGLMGQEESETGPISTDRPTQSASAFLVPKGTLQIETGFFRLSENLGFVGVQNAKFETIVFNSTQIRYGISDRVELRFSQELIKSRIKQGGNVTDESNLELIPTSIGARIHLFDMNDRGGPQTSLLMNIGGPVFSDIPTGTTFDFRFNMQNNLSESLALAYNIGGVFADEFNTFSGLATVMLGYTTSEKVSLFAELYMNFPDFADAFLQTDFGLLYIVSPNVQLDVFAGVGISEFTPDSLFGAGLSLRIPGK